MKQYKQQKKSKKRFKSRLGEITSGNPEHKSANQSDTIKNAQNLQNSRQKIIDLLNDNTKIKSEAIYETKQDETKGAGLKILTPKQLLQRLPIALAQLKAGNNSESLLNEIMQIVYSLYQSKTSLKKYTITKMDTIFMNSQNSKTSEPHILILKLTDKLDLKRGEKIIALSNLSIHYTCKNIKSSYNNNKFKISAPTWNDKFELPDGSYSASNIQDYFEYILKKHGENIDNPSVKNI